MVNSYLHFIGLLTIAIALNVVTDQLFLYRSCGYEGCVLTVGFPMYYIESDYYWSYLALSIKYSANVLFHLSILLNMYLLRNANKARPKTDTNKNPEGAGTD